MPQPLDFPFPVPRPLNSLPKVLALVLLPVAFAVSPHARPAVGAETGFVTGIGDLPLMDGLAPVSGQAVLFDKPGGRIVQAVATGRIPADAVRGFYARTLPQLGWRPAGRDRFAREGEALSIEFMEASASEPLTVRFMLSPQ